jgi:hypothetical protein
MRRRAPAEARETLPRLSWRARFLTIGIGGSVHGERPRDGTCAEDKNARPVFPRAAFGGLCSLIRQARGLLWVSTPRDAWVLYALVLALDGVG